MADDHDVADQVLVAIRQIVQRISEHSKQLSRDHGLTVPQLVCLRAIAELSHHTGEVTVAMVSGAAQLSPATVSRIVERLVRADLVVRRRGSRDRRTVCLTLSEQGHRRYASLPLPLQEQFVNGLHRLSHEEQTTILASLQRLVDLMARDESAVLADGLEPHEASHVRRANGRSLPEH